MLCDTVIYRVNIIQYETWMYPNDEMQSEIRSKGMMYNLGKINFVYISQCYKICFFIA